MDPEATTDAFRERYLRIVRETAQPYLWPAQRSRLTIVAGVARRPVAGDRGGARGAVPGRVRKRGPRAASGQTASPGVGTSRPAPGCPCAAASRSRAA